MKATLLCITLLLILAVPASAQWDEGIRRIQFDTITGGFEAIRVAVDNIRPAEGVVLTADDSTLATYATRVLQRDIEFYADFDLVVADPFYLKTYEIEILDLLGWMRLGGEYVVRTEVRFSNPNMEVHWHLYDAKRQREIADGEFSYNRAFWRELAHDIANHVVHKLTGDPGIFRTQVVYAKKMGEGKELFISDYDGANERQLTKNKSINVSPAFAPDQQTVYFTSYEAGDPQLFRVNVTSGEIRQIGSFPGSVTAPSVSPDGKKVAAVLSKDGNHEIYVLDLQGRIIKRVTHHRAIESSPTWSPDGRFIAFSSDRTGSPQVYITDSDGQSTRRLTYQGGYNDSPLWSRKGDRITFVSRTPRGRFDLASIDTSGTDYRILTELGHNENPHFSPDGKHIIFSSTRLSAGDLYTMDISGRNQRRLTRDGKSSNPTWGPLR
jgi:TolB protein